MKSNIYRIQVLSTDAGRIIAIEHKKSVKEFFYTDLNELKALIIDSGYNESIAIRLVKAIGYMLSSNIDYHVLSIKPR